MKHSAILQTQNHAIVAANALPGNPALAASAVMIQDVSFSDACRISAEVARHGLPALVWEPSITVPAEPGPPVQTQQATTPEVPASTEPPPEPEQPA